MAGTRDPASASSRSSSESGSGHEVGSHRIAGGSDRGAWLAGRRLSPRARPAPPSASSCASSPAPGSPPWATPGWRLPSGIQSVYYNPGAIGDARRTGLQFTHSVWFADIDYDYAAAALPDRRVGNLLRQRDRLNSGRDRRAHRGAAAGHRGALHGYRCRPGPRLRAPDHQRFAAGIQVNYINESDLAHLA